MARTEQDKEDILREATALVERAELRVEGEREPVIVGFRRGGAASIFFGGEPVYQFNIAGELRRAYAGGRLFKAERGRLVALSRRRTEKAVELVRNELDDAEQLRFLDEAASRISSLAAAIEQGSFELLGQICADGDVVSKIEDWIGAITLPPRVAKKPGVA